MSARRVGLVACLAAGLSLAGCATTGDGDDSGNGNSPDVTMMASPDVTPGFDGHLAPETSAPHDTGVHADAVDAGSDSGTHDGSTGDSQVGTDTGPAMDVTSPQDAMTTPDVSTGPEASMPDATMPPPDSGVVDTGVVDTGPPVDTGLNTIPTYGPCSMSDQCVSAQCENDAPQGWCTTGCSTTMACGGNGACLPTSTSAGMPGFCLPPCTSGGGQCTQYGAACAQVGSTTPAPMGCIPSCFAGSGAPAGYAACQNGKVCDPYYGVCVAAGQVSTAGVANGGACTMDSDCHGGVCFTENDPTTDAPTGFLGGYCVSYGLEVASTSLRSGQPIPQSNCPQGSAPFQDGTLTAGDLISCITTCMRSSNCRPGYGCFVAPAGTGNTSNGYCLPIDCGAGTEGNCPTGYACAPAPASSGAIGMCTIDCSTGTACPTGQTCGQDVNGFGMSACQ